MKVTLILKKSVTRYDTESQATIYARLRDGRQLDLVAPTRLTINPNLWDDKAEQVKSKVVCDEAMRTRYNNEARRLKTYIERAYQNRPEEPVYTDGGDAMYLIDQVRDPDGEDSWISGLQFRQTVAGLTPREKRIMELRYLRGKTQMAASRRS